MEPLAAHKPVMPFGWIGQTATVATGRGVNVQTLMGDAGLLARDGYIRPETELDPADFMLMCVLLINSVEDEMHGTTRSRMRLGTATMGARVMGTAKTFGAGIGTLLKFYQMAGGFCAVTPVRKDGWVILEIHADGGASSLTSLVEELMANHLHMIFSYFLGFFLRLERFQTPSADHPYVGRIHPYLKSPVRHGGPTALVFSADHLALPPKGQMQDRSMFDAISFWLAQYGGDHVGARLRDGSAPFSALVYDALMQEDAAFEDLCAQLAIAPRDLRQGLFAEGGSYRRLRRAALLDRVRPHLLADANTDDIALSLGYSDARSLRRAIKLAGGLSLSDLRQAAPSRLSIGAPVVIENLRQQVAYMEG